MRRRFSAGYLQYLAAGHGMLVPEKDIIYHHGRSIHRADHFCPQRLEVQQHHFLDLQHLSTNFQLQVLADVIRPVSQFRSPFHFQIPIGRDQSGKQLTTTIPLRQADRVGSALHLQHFRRGYGAKIRSFDSPRRRQGGVADYNLKGLRLSKFQASSSKLIHNPS